MAGALGVCRVVVILCWVLSMLSILSLLIVPLLGFALFRTSRRGAWIPMLAILAGNPTGFWFASGLVDYARGAPALHGMGLPSIESYNIDRRTRCFFQTGGCLVSGNEWVSQDFHNLGVLTLATVFGTPSRSYDGPYPDKEEALRMVETSPKLDLSELAKGRIKVGDRISEVPPATVEGIMSSLRLFSLMGYQVGDDAADTYAQAAEYEDRCLIVRIVELDSMPASTGSRDQDYMVLIDRKNMRPFAYFRNKGDRASRNPSVRYLPEHSR